MTEMAEMTNRNAYKQQYFSTGKCFGSALVTLSIQLNLRDPLSMYLDIAHNLVRCPVALGRIRPMA